MTFEGEHKIIPIKGIARAGADSLCEDGAMNEVIGLEYKDGSYVPYSGVLSGRGVPSWAHNIYIHKTSTQNNIIVNVYNSSESGLLWMSEERFNTTEDISDYGEWEVLYDGNVKDIEFIKNIICISTADKLLYILFQEGEYKEWTVNKEELPRINFRVDIGIGGKTDALGIKRSVYYSDYPEGGIKDALVAPLIAARGKAIEEGGLIGYFLACAAYRLKTGEYVKASNPVLLCRPMHKEKDKLYDEKTDSNKFTLYKWGEPSVSKTFTPSINEKGVSIYIESDADHFTPEDFSYLKKNEVTDIKSMYDNCLFIVDGNNDVYGTRYTEDFYMFYPPMGSSCIHYPNASTKITQAYYAAAVPTNKLQYKINSDITLDDSQISSLCIFISKEIDPFINLDNKDNIDKTYMKSSVKLSDSEYISSLHAIFKTDDEIVNEIKNINNLYLVHEIDYTDIKKSNEWIDVDLKGKLGDALVTRETLPISAFDNTIIKDATMVTYNSRLHIYNYKEEERCGYNIEDYNLYGGYGQYSASEEEYESAYIAIDYNSESGSSRIVKHFDKPTITTGAISGTPSFNQYIAYHKGNASKITLFLKPYSSLGYYVTIYDLTKSKHGGYSFHLTKHLTPTLAGNQINTNGLPEQFNESTQRESMRVSDAFLPQTFQYANTYTIGNGKIVGIATLSIALSQDTFGQYPLLVFCTDGIYSMGVDTTGAGVYNNIAPFSREVCINRNTICEIDGTVLFASSKGLMIATAQGVQEFVPSLNGEPKHLPQDDKTTKGLGLALYKEAINHELAVQLTGCISSEDFIDFLKDGNTVVSYASEKNNIVVYNPSKPYTYWIDIPTRNVTKLPVGIRMDNNNYPNEEYVTAENRIMMFKHLSSEGDVQCMLQSRPIKVDGRMKSYMRVVARGYFNSLSASNFAVILVLGSYDGINWQPLGNKQKKIGGGFHDLGCVVDRVSCEYIMVIVSGSLTPDSHIDGIELTKINKYNNKLK